MSKLYIESVVKAVNDCLVSTSRNSYSFKSFLTAKQHLTCVYEHNKGILS